MAVGFFIMVIWLIPWTIYMYCRCTCAPLEIKKDHMQHCSWEQNPVVLLVTLWIEFVSIPECTVMCMAMGDCSSLVTFLLLSDSWKEKQFQEIGFTVSEIYKESDWIERHMYKLMSSYMYMMASSGMLLSWCNSFMISSCSVVYISVTTCVLRYHQVETDTWNI